MNSRSGYTSVSLNESEMGESLVAPVVADNLPVATARPMMEVVAPATLREGYEFDVTIGPNQTVKVRVPLGGVEQGQTFQVPFPDKAHPPLATGVHIPVGHWRDGLFECFKHGICHPHLWTSSCCTFLATGQVIHRMQFDWTGRVTDSAQRKAAAFTIIFAIVMVYFVVHWALYFTILYLDPNHGRDPNDPEYIAQDLPVSLLVCLAIFRVWGFIYWIGSTVVLIYTRRSVRQRYAIPAQDDLEDCCCSVFCHCCVAAQMLRHTTDYDVYPSYCLSETGLPSTAPSVV